MRSIVAKNVDSNAVLSKIKVNYPKAYSLADLKPSDSDAEDQS